MKKMERVVSQMTSGRWLLTIVAAMCLLLFTVTDCWAVYRGKTPPISPEAIATIITMVFMSYFKSPKEGGDEDDELVPPTPPTPPVPPAPPVVPPEPPKP